MPGTVLITTATGAQGGAVAWLLLDRGWSVRAMVRDPEVPAAVGLARRGAELALGDYEDEESVRAACQGVEGVFSVQLPSSPDDPGSEKRHGAALVRHARSAGVRTFVHSSVARAGDEENFAGWTEGRWWSAYWTGKSAVNKAVRGAGFPAAVILKPAFMMDNFALPKAAHMVPTLAAGRIVTALEPDVPLHLIAASDIAAFAVAAFNAPDRFAGSEIDLAAEALTMREAAAAITRVIGSPIEAVHVSPEAAITAGIPAGVVANQTWCNVEGYAVDVDRLRAEWRVALTSFENWLAANRDRLPISVTQG